MPARRDYAAAWRDSAALLAQVPVAGLQATGFFYQQWLERSSSYLSLVTTRLALTRRLAGDDATPDKDVMATVLSEDLFDETRTLVQNLVLLPGEAAKHFNLTLEDLSRAVLARVQPDAQADVRTYVGNQLAELGQELNNLQEVAKAERARRKAAGRPTRDPEARPPGNIEKLLDGVQERIERALTHFSRKPLPPRRPDLTVQQQRVIAAHLKIEKAQGEERLGKKDLREARASAARRRGAEKRKRPKYRPGARQRAGG